MDILKSIEEAVLKGQMDGVKRLTQQALDRKIPPNDILNKGLIKGLEKVGKLFECQEIFVPELLMAGMAMKDALAILQPILEKSDIPPVGKLVIGTVEGDVHDIGKNIVSMIFAGSGFQVTDLGIDVSAKKFIETVEKEKPDVLALSCLYTPTRLAMNDVMRLLKEKKSAQSGEGHHRRRSHRSELCGYDRRGRICARSSFRGQEGDGLAGKIRGSR